MRVGADDGGIGEFARRVLKHMALAPFAVGIPHRQSQGRAGAAPTTGWGGYRVAGEHGAAV